MRVSESLAKMSLSPVASERHVDEAIRLFNISTLHAIQSSSAGGLSSNSGLVKEIEGVQQYMLRRMPRGSTISHSNLVNDLNKQVLFIVVVVWLTIY